MPRSAGVAITNSFTKGLVTEATGLNFPEDACTQTSDCVFNYDGSVNRRMGWDFEAGSTLKQINRTNNAVSTYLWRNVNGDGNTTLVVLQVGPTLYFYKTNQLSFSLGAVAATGTLSPNAQAIAAGLVPDQVEAQFADGNGILFVTHPYCDPQYIVYNVTNDTITAFPIQIMIRDFEGQVSDITSNPSIRPPQAKSNYTAAGLGTASPQHVYNLFNQGWTQLNLQAWNVANANLPSNADVMFLFKTSQGIYDFNLAGTFASAVVQGNSQAAQGHYIYPLSQTTRSASLSADTGFGVGGLQESGTGAQRPSTAAFFEGRVFYAGVNAQGFNSTIYFTQIVTASTQTLNPILDYGACYQQNDPTSENFFDLLPSDGGVVRIPDAGTIYKLVAVPGGLAIFAANGVWFLTGSTGIGFTANDYSLQKIALIQSISGTSFISVNGYPVWWNNEGIYMMSIEGSNSLPTIKPLSYPSIKAYYDTIPLSSKKFARGFFNYIDGRAYWLFRSTPTTQVTSQYEFDSVLNLNTRTGAFHPWTVPKSNDGLMTMNAIIISDTQSGQVNLNTVVDNALDFVQDAAGDQVVSFTSTGVVASLSPKFLVSYPSGGSYNFTWAEAHNTSYLDWFQYDTVGVNYTSSLTTGYRLRGQGTERFQSNWVNVFSKISNIPQVLGPSGSTAYYFQGVWDYALTALGTGHWSTQQLVVQTDPTGLTQNLRRRLKVRGQGFVLQFNIQSVPGQPFYLIGWSTYDTLNAIP